MPRISGNAPALEVRKGRFMGRELCDNAAEAEIREDRQRGDADEGEPESLMFGRQKKRNEKKNDRAVDEAP